MKPEQQEIARLQREVAKLKAARGTLEKLRPTSQRNRHEVRLHRGAPPSTHLRTRNSPGSAGQDSFFKETCESRCHRPRSRCDPRLRIGLPEWNGPDVKFSGSKALKRARAGGHRHQHLGPCADAGPARHWRHRPDSAALPQSSAPNPSIACSMRQYANN